MSVAFEYLFLVFLLLGGYIFLWASGVTRAARFVFAITAGVCIYIAIAYLQIVTFLPTYPILTLAIFAVMSAALLLRGKLYAQIDKFDGLYLIIYLAVILSIVLLCHSVSLAKFHFDSLRYLIVGSL